MNKYLLLFTGFIFMSLTSIAHPSWGIVVDKNKNIYFADIAHNGRGSVWKLTKEGKLELLFKDFHAHNVNLDNNGNLITAHGEMDEHTMIRLHANGFIDTLFHANDYRIFNGGNCTYTPKGEIIFSANHYLWRLNEQGVKEKISKHYFEWNQTIYVDEDGNYYAPDIGDGKGKLVKIDTNGIAEVIAQNLITKINRPYDKHADVLMGITKGCDGNIYVAELAGQRIIKISEKGAVETFYQFKDDWKPTGIDFFSGDAYILAYKEKNGHAGPRIVKIDESGNLSEVFNFETHKKDESIESTPINNRVNRTLLILILTTLPVMIVLLYRLKKIWQQKTIT